MTEIEKSWQAIDRAIGFIQGFVPAVWAMSAADEREVVSVESIGAYEEVVADLAVSLARVRELTGVVDA